MPDTWEHTPFADTFIEMGSSQVDGAWSGSQSHEVSVSTSTSHPDESGDTQPQAQQAENDSLAPPEGLPPRYEARRLLGKGGFAVVWAATDRITGRRVAVKVLRRDIDIRVDKLRRFEAEVRAAARLSHPNVVDVYDVIDHAGRAALVMELAPGKSLRRMMRTRLALSAVRDIAFGVLSALAYAHAHGVIHRDLKPENIVVEYRAGAFIPKLLDFGVACLIDDPKDAGSAGLAGTPEYMAPEQIRTEIGPVQPATDLYAFGVLLYEMLSGRPPFMSDNHAAIFQEHLSTPPPTLEDLLPAGIWPIIACLLDKDPAQRYQLAADVLRDLRNLDWPNDNPQTDAPMAPLIMRLTGEHDEVRSLVPSLNGSYAGSYATRTNTAPIFPVRTGVGMFEFRVPPLLGREHEQETLMAAARATLNSQSARAVIIEGEPGIGKSRLVEWLRTELEQSGDMIAWRVAYQPEGVHPGVGFIGAVERALHLSGCDEAKIARRITRTLAGAGPHDLGTRVAAWLRRGASAVGGASAALACAVELMAALAKKRGLLLVLEDVQWAQPGQGLALLSKLLDHQLTEPISLLMVATLRREDPACSPQIQRELEQCLRHRRVSRMVMGRLGDEVIERILATIIELDEPVRKRLAAHVGGNPLFATQLLSHCLRAGVLSPGESGVLAGADGWLEGAQLPETIRDLSLRRVDALAARSDAGQDAVAVAQIAAMGVEGVPYQVLSHVIGDDERLHRARRALVQEGLWSESLDIVRFEHRVLRDSLLQRGAPDNARELHRRWARAWADYAQGKLLIPSVIEARARHLDAAGDRDQALPLFIQVARLRLDDGSFGAACELSRRALHIAEPGGDPARPDALGETLLILGRALEGMGAVAEALRVLSRAIAELAEPCPADAALARAHRGWVNIWRADYDAALRDFADAESVFRAHLDSGEQAAEDLIAYSLRGRCWVAFQTRDIALAERLNGEALAVYTRTGNLVGQGWCLKNLAAIRIQQGDLGDARARAEAALLRFRTVHEHNGIASVHSDLGDEALIRGAVNEALSHFQIMRRAGLLAGNDNHRRAALAKIVACKLQSGLITEANQMLDELALSLSSDTEHWLVPTLQALRAWAYALSGRLEEAQDALALARHAPDDDPLRARAMGAARALLHQAAGL